MTPPFLTADDDEDDAAPLTGSRFVDVDAAAAPPLVVKSWLWKLLLCNDDVVVEPADLLFVDRHGSLRKMDDDLAALTNELLSVIEETTAMRQTVKAVAAA